MPSLTIRIRTPGETIAIEQLKQETQQQAASKALMTAAMTFPLLSQELRVARRRIKELEGVVRECAHAIDAASEARDLVRLARERAVDVLSGEADEAPTRSSSRPARRRRR